MWQKQLWFKKYLLLLNVQTIQELLYSNNLIALGMFYIFFFRNKTKSVFEMKSVLNCRLYFCCFTEMRWEALVHWFTTLLYWECIVLKLNICLLFAWSMAGLWPAALILSCNREPMTTSPSCYTDSVCIFDNALCGNKITNVMVILNEIKPVKQRHIID